MMVSDSLNGARYSVGHITYSFFMPSTTFIYGYLSRLARVHPICLSLWTPIVNTDLFPFPESDCYSFDDDNRPRLRKEWTRVRRVVMRSTSPGKWRRPIDRIAWAKRVLLDRKARLIHAHFGPIGWQVLPLRRDLNIPLVTSFYGFDVAPEVGCEGPDWPQRRQELFDQGDLFLVEGPIMRQRLIDLGCPAQKVWIQRIGVNVKHLSFTAPTVNGLVTILFAGRFCEKKGLIYALRAICALRERGCRFRFRIIGDGELMGEIKDFIGSNRLEDCVELLGFLTHEEYLQEMKRADIFIHPSVTAANGDSEGGAPTVILEAHAFGVPVVSTYHADIPNVTLPGQSALLVQERDSEALADALAHLIDNPSARREMGMVGRSFVERHHDLDQEVALLENTYGRVLEAWRLQTSVAS